MDAKITCRLRIRKHTNACMPAIVWIFRTFVRWLFLVVLPRQFQDIYMYILCNFLGYTGLFVNLKVTKYGGGGSKMSTNLHGKNPSEIFCSLAGGQLLVTFKDLIRTFLFEIRILINN